MLSVSFFHRPTLFLCCLTVSCQSTVDVKTNHGIFHTSVILRKVTTKNTFFKNLNVSVLPERCNLQTIVRKFVKW